VFFGYVTWCNYYDAISLKTVATALQLMVMSCYARVCRQCLDTEKDANHVTFKCNFFFNTENSKIRNSTFVVLYIVGVYDYRVTEVFRTGNAVRLPRGTYKQNDIYLFLLHVHRSCTNQQIHLWSCSAMYFFLASTCFGHSCDHLQGCSTLQISGIKDKSHKMRVNNKRSIKSLKTFSQIW
jgi:hypothetical protein